MLLPPVYEEKKWSLAAQCGIKNTITKAAPELTGMEPPYKKGVLETIKNGFEERGFCLVGLEGDQFDMSRIKLGLPGRDEDIECFKSLLREMGRLDIPMICWNFMASIGWFRTRADLPERGGALTSEFRLEDMEAEPLPAEKQISEDKLWDNIGYFLKSVLPEAERAGVRMALHPDDPPVSPIRGVGRILTSAEAYDRLFQEFPSPSLGAAFCQATFRAMGEDILAVSERWIRKNRFFFIHLRDIEGDKTCFRETFHDNGPTEMALMLKHYASLGFNGPIRPDHAPAMYGERTGEFSSGLSAGYEMMGKIFAVGYIKGICESAGIELD